MNRKTFVLYTDSLVFLEELTDEEVGRVFRAIANHVNGTDYSLSKIEKLAFLPIRTYLDRDLVAYQRVVSRNQENGKKGGRPTKTGETQANPKNPVGYLETQENPKNLDNDIEIDIVIENDLDSDIKTKKHTPSQTDTPTVVSGPPDGVKPPKPSKSPSKQTRPPTDIHQLVEHTHSIQGLPPYLSKPRQYKAAKDILAAYPLDQAKQVAEAMHDDQYWKKTTFDVVQLQNNFHKYVAKVAVEEEYDEVVERQSEIAYQMLLELQAKEEAEQRRLQEAHGD